MDYSASDAGEEWAAKPRLVTGGNKFASGIKLLLFAPPMEGAQIVLGSKDEVSIKAIITAQDKVLSDLTKDFAQTTLQEGYEFIDTVESMPAVIGDLVDQPGNPPSLYIDLEGVNLSRQGSISILQIHVAPQKKTYLIDIHNLGSKAFDTTGELNHTLRSVLQSASIPKVFFDVRNDSDALFSHFDIALAGVIDLQIMEYGTRSFRKGFVNGLSKCIERDLDLSYSQRLEWQRVKQEGIHLFTPERGGTYEVFNQRPLSDAIGLYCVQDVQWLPALYQTYLRKVSKTMSAKIARATLDRVKDSQRPFYVGHGQHKVKGPW